MKSFYFLCGASMIAFGLGPSLSLAQTPSQADDPSSSLQAAAPATQAAGPDGLEEIVVTAQRRSKISNGFRLP